MHVTQAPTVGQPYNSKFSMQRVAWQTRHPPPRTNKTTASHLRGTHPGHVQAHCITHTHTLDTPPLPHNLPHATATLHTAWRQGLHAHSGTVHLIHGLPAIVGTNLIRLWSAPWPAGALPHSTTVVAGQHVLAQGMAATVLPTAGQLRRILFDGI